MSSMIYNWHMDILSALSKAAEKRHRAGETWEQIASDAGVSRQYLHRVLSNSATPRISVVEKMAKGLGLKIIARKS